MDLVFFLVYYNFAFLSLDFLLSQWCCPVYQHQGCNTVFTVPLIALVFVLPVCVQCRRSASGDQSRRWCLPGRSSPCAPLPLYGRSWPPASRSGWTRPCCGSACRMGGKQRVSWEQTASHCINAAVSSRVTLTGRDGGFMACVFNPLTSSAKQFCKRRTLTWHIRKYQRTMGTN